MDSARDFARLAKHSLVIRGHATSVSLEEAFWRSLKDIAAARGLSLAGLVADIDEGRRSTNLSSAIRVFVLAETLKTAQRTMDQA